MFVRRSALASLSLAAIATFAPAAHAQPDPATSGVCYATLGNNASSPGALITVDPLTGAGTLVGPTGIVGGLGDSGVPALAIRSTGEIYATDIGTPSNLYRIDATTGAATLVHATTLASPPAITFDGSDVLWAVDVTGKLHVLNEITGASTLVGACGAFIKGMTFDPTTGVLWACDASGGIFTVNTQTAVATLVGTTGLPQSSDLYCDALGVLYASSGGGFNVNNLITIDKVTGAGQVVGSIGFASVSGLATRLDRFVPVALQAYDANWVKDHVEVTWRLSFIEGPLSFEIARADENGAFVPLNDARIEEDRGTFTYVDESVVPATAYRYRVAVFENGDPVTEFETGVSTPVADVVLGQNFPNPFNPTTNISFATAIRGHVSLRIYDSAGRTVRTLVDGETPAGTFTASWNGRDEDGRPVASGVYFYRLEAGRHVHTRKAVLLK